jgi:hypothetical protein
MYLNLHIYFLFIKKNYPKQTMSQITSCFPKHKREIKKKNRKYVPWAFQSSASYCCIVNII